MESITQKEVQQPARADVRPDAIRIIAVLPVHNRRALTLQCLESLFASDLNGLDLGVVVVDDGSSDGTASAIRSKFSSVELVRGDGTLWYTAGLNRGIAAALQRPSDYLLFMNDDQIFDRDALQGLVACAQMSRESVVGAMLVHWDDPGRVFQVDPRWELRFGGWHHWQRLRVEQMPESPWEVEMIVGNCVLVPRRAVDEVGLLDEKRLPDYGDAEYTVRLRRRGWKLVVSPGAVVRCQPNALGPNLRTSSVGDRYKALWGNRHSPYNLKHQFWTRYLSAPSKAEGASAFLVYLALCCLKAFGLAGDWPYREPRGPSPGRQHRTPNLGTE